MVNDFAEEGYRTLLLTTKEIDEQWYQEWNYNYTQASLSLQDRDEKMAEIAAEIETNLTLIGSTAIEDKLQSGVPEAIISIKAAGINLWLLTGDKIETAINIGYSAGLLDNSMN